MNSSSSFLPVLFLLLLFAPVFSQVEKPNDAAFVWTNDHGEGRLQVAFFRRTFSLSELPAKADIHLFADSRYHLSVNGQFINFGPARFYPEHPRYDSYDLLPYLRKGANCIAVKVLSNGTSTFQLRRNPAAFIAWGDVSTSDGVEINLATPGNWTCYQSKGYHADAARMTFALGPMEIYDAGKDKTVLGWETPEFNASGWAKPQPLIKQNTWGTLTPRNIPPLTRDPYAPRELLGVYDWRNEEDLYSFQVLKPDKSWEEFRTASPFIGYTYIYSPFRQDVEVGLWWGEHFLNAERPLKQEPAPEKPHRQQAVMKLNAGWNFFAVRRNSFFGKWAFVLAVPKHAGLVLSPNRKKDDSPFFRTAGPFPEAQEDAIKALSLSEVPTTIDAKWQDHRQSDLSGNPAIEMAWRYFNRPLPHDSWQRDDVKIGNATTGTSVVYDFRYKKLGRIKIYYEAPEGTVFDIGFTEDLNSKGHPNLMKRNGLYMATRHITAAGRGTFETIKPYGLRYLQVNVHRNEGPVVLNKVEVINHIYPFEQTGSFECSDPVFNDIWKMGWRTLEVCAEDSYTDTPFRERGLYAGDMLPQLAVTLACCEDLRLIKRSLELFQDMYIDQFNPNIPRHPDEIGLLEDYPLLTLEALSWYVDRTGDLAFAKSLFDAYDRLLKNILAKRNDAGIIHNKRVFIEWTQIEKREVSNTAFHAILTRACKLYARLAQKLGDEKRSNEYQKIANE